MSRKAQELIATSDKAWDVVKTQRLRGKDARTLDIYRKRYVAGVPKRPIAQEEADARTLYGALAALGGEKLVGSSTTLDPGTFYKDAKGTPH
jgi:NitT/TauT family transport system substrate-binding protein